MQHTRLPQQQALAKPWQIKADACQLCHMPFEAEHTYMADLALEPLAHQHSSPATLLCHHCQAQLPKNQHYCRCCAEPLNTAAEHIEAKPLYTCASCQHLQQQGKAKAFIFAEAPLLYSNECKHILTQLKHHQKAYHRFAAEHILARFLARLNHEKSSITGLIAVIPTPMAPAHNARRGNHHSLLLAQAFVAQLHSAQTAFQAPSSIAHGRFELNLQAFSKSPNSQQLKTMKTQARFKNVKRSLTLNYDVLAPYDAVLLLDDVITTTATISAMSEMIADKRSLPIYALALLRTPKSKLH